MRLHTGLAIRLKTKRNKPTKNPYVRVLMLSHSETNAEQSVCLRVKNGKIISLLFFLLYDIIARSIMYTSGLQA